MFILEIEYKTVIITLKTLLMDHDSFNLIWQLYLHEY